MKTRLAASMLLAGTLNLLLVGCGGWPSLRGAGDAATAGVKPALSSEAEAALARAEAEVSAARAAFTLWTPAAAALERARAAAAQGDSASVIGEAKLVSELCALSRAQADYPPTDIP